ncbi:hypothetical protein [Streptomyces sp. TRM64462]|uniref:hypothetical protein n=1 Tax=Streptomyces sp. TRM64462 TaxID=2741726 RepID=UPI001586E2CB|nr:hypothetical protein [Streptomyces sp. TRM64462]
MTFGKVPLVLYRDGNDIRLALRGALASAADTERPGLERALAIIEAQCARSDGEVLAHWARSILDDAGIDAAREHVKAVAAVRKAVPDLSLLAANRLVTEVTAGR